MNTPEKLVALGEVAIRQRGYSGFSYADIAQEAGIRKASIHHHFPTKSEFTRAVLESYGNALAEKLDTILRSSRHGGQALKEIVALYREALSEGEAICLCASLASDTHALDDQIRLALQDVNARVARSLEEVLRRGRADRSVSVAGEPEIESIAILAQLQGAQLLARLAGDPALFDVALTGLHARINRA